MSFWWCLHHRRVEGEEGCAHAERLGPYATADEAERALESAAQRSDAWDDEDRRWEQRR